MGGQTASFWPSRDRPRREGSSARTAPPSRARRRDAFEHVLLALNVPQPRGRAVTRKRTGRRSRACRLLTGDRPSELLLGGARCSSSGNETQLRQYLKNSVETLRQARARDKVHRGKVERSRDCDGRRRFVPGIRSWSSAPASTPATHLRLSAFSISGQSEGHHHCSMRKRGARLRPRRLFNIQLIVDRSTRVIIEVTPP